MAAPPWLYITTDKTLNFSNKKFPKDEIRWLILQN